MNDDIIRPPPKKAITLRNRTCIYCNGVFGLALERTKEHVIGRRFVPKGTFDGQWNLIAAACRPCNGEKADLEDDISVISMMPDLQGRFAIDDQRLASEIERKAMKARSRRTGKTVANSHEQFKFQVPIGSRTGTFTFDVPPQIDEARIWKLAHFQFRAFFYWITFDYATQVGGFVPGGFYPLLSVRRADWGNPVAHWFEETIRDWDLRIHAIGADEYFKMIIRKHPHVDVWCWALEWNHNIRTFGFAGDEIIVREYAPNLPDQGFSVVLDDGDRFIRMRHDLGLLAEDDDLFQTPPEATPSFT